MDKFPDPRGDPYHYGDGGGCRFQRRKQTSILASCVVATLFLLVAAAALAAVFFTLFRPRDPGLQVTAVRLPSYAPGGNGTVSFTFEQLAAVRNPNRATFSHYESSLQLIYEGAQVGFMFIPAGEIGGGRTQYMAASFSVRSFQSQAGGGGAARAAEEEAGDGGRMELQSRMMVRGRVQVLRFLMHHVEATVACRVVVAVRDGSVVGFRC